MKKLLEDVEHLEDVLQVTIGYLENENCTNILPAITTLKGAFKLCERLYEGLVNEAAKKTK